MGRNLGWIAVVAFAVSWFVEVHQMQEMAGSARAMASGLGEAMNNMAESMGEGLGGGAPPRVRVKEPDLSDMPGNYGGPPGWKACRFAFDLLTGENKPKDPDKDALKTKLLGATSLTNVVMVLAILMLLLSTRGLSRLVGVLLLACAALNLGWIYHNESDFVDGLRLGYYLWTGSFVLAGLAALVSRPA